MKRGFTLALVLTISLTTIAYPQRAKRPLPRTLEGVVVDTTGGARWMGIVVESEGKRYVVATANNPDNHLRDPVVVGEVGIGARVRIVYTSTESFGMETALHATRIETLPAPATPRGEHQSATTSVPSASDSASLDSAMRTFIDSMRQKDATTFFALFSKSRPWRHLNTISGASMAASEVQLVNYSMLTRGKYLNNFFHDCTDAEDICIVFRDQFKTAKWKMWRRVGSTNKFVPPDGPDTNHVYVKWRSENGKWVVDEIGDPQS